MEENREVADFNESEKEPTQVGVPCSQCGSLVTGKFCLECGTPVMKAKICPNCKAVVTGNFCQECGTKME